MRPIPDDVEPAPRALAGAVLADAGALARMDSGARWVATPHEPSKPAPCSDTRHRALTVRRVAPDEWIIGSGVLDVVRSERKAILVPQVDPAGRVVGLSIRDAGDDSCLGALGFEDGDLIQSINSFALEGDWSSFPTISASITKNGKAVVRFERGGRPMTVVYEVQGE